ncbi:MAG: flagellar hook-basal body complex protein FliE [Thermodesulfobacteriota bacterium]|nr:flagellar hook-basal body complex protein FliE [Thermodesulfobacteriota bacterium]
MAKEPTGDQKGQISFVDTLKDAIYSTNDLITDANKASLALASGKATNIHEAMIKMQKADIALRLLITSANKLIEGYNELSRLR